MSKKTLLRVVQDYLTYVSGFQVDSIFDSEESMQAAQIAEHVFNTIVDKNRDLMSCTVVRSLDPSTDGDLPCVLRIPSEIRRIHDAEIWYNEHTSGGVQYRKVRFVSPSDFMRLCEGDSTSASGTDIQYINGVPLIIREDKFPDYCTTFDDATLVFDSYHKEYDTTLQESKIKVVCTQSPVFVMEDTFEIPLPDRMLSGYTDTVISECMMAIRQTSHGAVARRSNQFLAKMQQTQKVIGNKLKPIKRFGRR